MAPGNGSKVVAPVESAADRQLAVGMNGMGIAPSALGMGHGKVGLPPSWPLQGAVPGGPAATPPMAGAALTTAAPTLSHLPAAGHGGIVMPPASGPALQEAGGPMIGRVPVMGMV